MKNLFTARTSIIVVTGALCAATVIAICGVFSFDWRYGLPTTDKTQIVNTVISACALALVGWGAVVALLAYISATGSPDLKPEITFNFSQPNQPVFMAHAGSPESGDFLMVEPFKQVDGRVVVYNKSKYAARNPGVLIELEGCGLRDSPLGEWRKVTAVNMIGVTSMQWDGGADYIIHGKWRRTLPPLNFSGLASYSRDPSITVSVAADGFAPLKTNIPLKILGPADYEKYMQGLKVMTDE
jgi:hypothetical protein